MSCYNKSEMAEKVAFKNNKHFKLYDQQEHFGLLCVSGETHLLCLKIGKAYDCEESLLFPEGTQAI